MFYLHPWEIDKYQPRDLDIPLHNKFIHYYNINNTLIKLKKIDFVGQAIVDFGLNISETLWILTFAQKADYSISLFCC